MTGRSRVLAWGLFGATMAGIAGNLVLAAFGRSLPAQISDWPTFVTILLLIILRQQNGHLMLTVIDDGIGFDPGAASIGTGVQNMKDRVASLGGSLSLESQPGKGTTVSGSLPLVPMGVAQ